VILHSAEQVCDKRRNHEFRLREWMRDFISDTGRQPALESENPGSGFLIGLEIL
jgi:hypothetical protein